jgi:hypothetical protein
LSSIIGQYLGPLFMQEVPTGDIDGANVTFTLSQLPASPGAVQLSLDGIVLAPTVHYTISGVTITMIDAPVTGQNLQAQYIRA